MHAYTILLPELNHLSDQVYYQNLEEKRKRWERVEQEQYLDSNKVLGVTLGASVIGPFTRQQHLESNEVFRVKWFRSVTQTKPVFQLGMRKGPETPDMQRYTMLVSWPVAIILVWMSVIGRNFTARAQQKQERKIAGGLLDQSSILSQTRTSGLKLHTCVKRPAKLDYEELKKRCARDAKEQYLESNKDLRVHLGETAERPRHATIHHTVFLTSFSTWLTPSPSSTLILSSTIMSILVVGKLASFWLSKTQAPSGVWMSDASCVSNWICAVRGTVQDAYLDTVAAPGPGCFFPLITKDYNRDLRTWTMWRFAPGLILLATFGHLYCPGYAYDAQGDSRGPSSMTTPGCWHFGLASIWHSWISHYAETGSLRTSLDLFVTRHLHCPRVLTGTPVAFIPYVASAAFLGFVFSETDGTHASAKGKTCVDFFCNIRKELKGPEKETEKLKKSSTLIRTRTSGVTGNIRNELKGPGVQYYTILLLVVHTLTRKPTILRCRKKNDGTKEEQYLDSNFNKNLRNEGVPYRHNKNTQMEREKQWEEEEEPVP
ncbi:hypothetical protein DFH06DRAFT_1150891 [Mycena polygramma]|nr:hypothetical protein DFH06DRAFT_1150891 [Mycena polygramma]